MLLFKIYFNLTVAEIYENIDMLSNYSLNQLCNNSISQQEHLGTKLCYNQILSFLPLASRNEFYVALGDHEENTSRKDALVAVHNSVPVLWPSIQLLDYLWGVTLPSLSNHFSCVLIFMLTCSCLNISLTTGKK